MRLKIKRDEQSSINLTPLIDIVFLLIIFFMVGTKFSELNEMERNIQLNVPAVSNAKALTAAPRKRVINVLKSGEIMLDDKIVTIGQLYGELSSTQSQYRKLGVVVRGDARTMYQRVAEVIATCQRAKISDVNISVREANSASLPNSVTPR